MLDVFNALTLSHKIIIVGITCSVGIMFYLMYRITRKPKTLGSEEVKLPPESKLGENAESIPEIESEKPKIVKPEKELGTIEEDKVFEEEKRKLEFFGKEKPEGMSKGLEEILDTIPKKIQNNHKEENKLSKIFIPTKKPNSSGYNSQCPRSEYESRSQMIFDYGATIYRKIVPLRIRHPLELCAGCGSKFDVMNLAEGKDGKFYCEKCLKERW